MALKGKLYEEAVQKLGNGELKHRGTTDLLGYAIAADLINDYVKGRLTVEVFNKYGFNCDKDVYYGLKSKFYEEAIRKLKHNSEEFHKLLNTKDIANAIENYVSLQMIKYYER